MALPSTFKTNLKLIVAYEGTRFLGWQKTKIGPSIEEALEKAFFQIYHFPVLLQAASRTDRGVHAKEQVVNLFLPLSPDLFRLKKSLNALLPRDISILSIEFAPLSFHPTVDAIGKEYLYFICNGETQLPFNRYFSWHFPYSLNLETMKKASTHFIGNHDFSAFTNLRTKETMRTITDIHILPLPEHRFCISITGNRFLYKMVRNLVGTLLYVGCKKISAEAIPGILASKDRRRAGVTAPAHGLTLARVFYPDKNGKL